jgi:hypothetical protein
MPTLPELAAVAKDTFEKGDELLQAVCLKGWARTSGWKAAQKLKGKGMPWEIRYLRRNRRELTKGKRVWVSGAKYDSEEAATDAIVDFWIKEEGYMGSETRRAAALASTTVAAEAVAMQEARRQRLEYIFIHIFVGRG